MFVCRLWHFIAVDVILLLTITCHTYYTRFNLCLGFSKNLSVTGISCLLAVSEQSQDLTQMISKLRPSHTRKRYRLIHLCVFLKYLVLEAWWHGGYSQSLLLNSYSSQLTLLAMLAEDFFCFSFKPLFTPPILLFHTILFNRKLWRSENKACRANTFPDGQLA